MAALPSIKRISREDLRDAPDWIDRLLYPLNLFLDSIYNGLNQGLTFSKNILSQQQQFSVNAGASSTDNTAKFTVTMKSKPKFIFLVGSTENGDILNPSFTWNYDGTYVNITSIGSLTNGSVYTFNALLIGE